MSQLARSTNALAKKDVEKTVAMEELKKLEGLKADGIMGNLKFSVFQIDGAAAIEDLVINFDVTPADFYRTDDTLTGKTKSDVMNTAMRLISKQIIISVEVTSSSDGTFLYKAAPLLVSDIPDDTEFRCELVARKVEIDLDAASEPSAKLSVHVKALFDRVDTLLSSKALELEQIEKELKDIGNQVKEARGKEQKGATAKKSTKEKSSKKKRRSGNDQSRDDGAEGLEGFEDGEGAGEGGVATSSSFISYITDFISIVPGLLIEKRAYLFFGVSAIAIFVGGDMASV